MTTTKLHLESLALLIRDLAIFCLTHGGRIYDGWTGETLFKYLSFQWLNGNVVVIHDGPDIAGIFMAWHDFAADILRREKEGKYHFAWRAPVDAGDALMVADVIVPKGSDGLTRLLQLASAKWPDWKMRRVFTHRRKKLVELQPTVLAHFLHEQP